jgi:hypothetical protein
VVQAERAFSVRYADTGQELARFPHTEEWYASLCWSPGGAFLASNSFGPQGTVRLWDVRGLTRPAAVQLAAARGAPAPAELRALPGALGPGSAALLLGPWWYGSGERAPALPGLRGLFVRPPGAAPGGAPALARACARWAAPDAGAEPDLSAVLAELLD